MARKNTLRREESVDVVRGRLGAYKDDGLALSAAFGGLVGVKDHSADRRARRGGKPLDDYITFRLRIDLRVKQLFDLLRRDARYRGLGVDESLVEHIHRDPHRGRRGAFPVTGLEDVEFSSFNGKFYILSVAVVGLKQLRDTVEFFVDLGHRRFERSDGHRGADTGDDIFALGVDEVFSEEFIFSVGGASCEADAGAAVVAKVSEYHRHDVNRRAVFGGNVVYFAVGDGARRVPAAEDGVYRQTQLHPWI